MDASAKQDLRDILGKMLQGHGDTGAFGDGESLFASGRLDSFSMVTLAMHLEETFGLDFSDVEFDVSLVDSVDDIEALVDRQASG